MAEAKPRIPTKTDAPPTVKPAPSPMPEKEMEPDTICDPQKEEVVRRIRK